MPKTLKVPRPSCWHKIGDRSIVVFDDLFRPDLVEALGIMATRLDYRRKPGYNEQLHVDFDDDFFARLPVLPETLAALAAAYKPRLVRRRVELKVYHAYAAAIRHDTRVAAHTDCECGDCLTFLYYANLHWSPSWGGETLFFDEEGDARHAVTPKPGRLVLFHANVVHRTGVPMYDCPSTRYTLSVFMRCKRTFLTRTFESDAENDSGEARWARLPGV